MSAVDDLSQQAVVLKAEVDEFIVDMPDDSGGGSAQDAPDDSTAPDQSEQLATV